MRLLSAMGCDEGGGTLGMKVVLQKRNCILLTSNRAAFLNQTVLPLLLPLAAMPN